MRGVGIGEGDDRLAELVLGGEARVDDRFGLLDEALPVSLDWAETEQGIGVEQLLHHVPAPPVDGMGIERDDLADCLAVLDPAVECLRH